MTCGKRRCRWAVYGISSSVLLCMTFCTLVYSGECGAHVPAGSHKWGGCYLRGGYYTGVSDRMCTYAFAVWVPSTLPPTVVSPPPPRHFARLKAVILVIVVTLVPHIFVALQKYQQNLRQMPSNPPHHHKRQTETEQKWKVAMEISAAWISLLLAADIKSIPPYAFCVLLAFWESFGTTMYKTTWSCKTVCP